MRKIIFFTLLGIITIFLIVGCSSNDTEPEQEVKQDVQEAEPEEEVKQDVQEAESEEEIKKDVQKAEPKVEEPAIKKEQYDVVWGTYDNEWVYSDEWTGEGFKNFDEAMNVLNQCMKESEEETEKCVYDYLLKK